MMMLKRLGRVAAGAAVAAAIGLVAVGPARAGGTTTIAEHGYWSTVVDMTDDGVRVCGVRTHMHDGGELRLEVIDNDIHLFAHDDNWHLARGGTTRVLITINGHGFTGTAKALDGQTLVIGSLTRRFVYAFMDGDELLADFGGVQWDVSLEGSRQATGEMAACALRGGTDVTS
jgi:hypothetical protein